MASLSKAQQGLMGIALSVKRGETDIADLDRTLQTKLKPILKMSVKQLEDYANTKHTNLPNRINESSYYKEFDNMMYKGKVTVDGLEIMCVNKGSRPVQYIKFTLNVNDKITYDFDYGQYIEILKMTPKTITITNGYHSKKWKIIDFVMNICSIILLHNEIKINNKPIKFEI